MDIYSICLWLSCFNIHFICICCIAIYIECTACWNRQLNAFISCNIIAVYNNTLCYKFLSCVICSVSWRRQSIFILTVSILRKFFAAICYLYCSISWHSYNIKLIYTLWIWCICRSYSNIKCCCICCNRNVSHVERHSWHRVTLCSCFIRTNCNLWACACRYGINLYIISIILNLCNILTGCLIICNIVIFTDCYTCRLVLKLINSKASQTRICCFLVNT